MVIKAKREVILSAGIFSCELLQRSGIGPAKLLACLGIPPVVVNEHVGRHSVNHLLVAVTLNNPSGAKKVDELYSGGAMLPALLPSDDANRRGYELIAIPVGDTTLISLLYLQSKSEGIIDIQGKDPFAPLIIDHNYFSVATDLQAFIRGIRIYLIPIIRDLTSRGYTLVTPTIEIMNDDAKLTKYIFNDYIPSHYWAGSCRMGDVVDGVGRVYGTTGLRVVDCSICPVINDGNTSAAAYLVGKVIGDAILAGE